MGGKARHMKALVTGGGGFLGKAIVQGLLARGDAVRSFSRSDYPELRALGVQVFRGDLASSGPALVEAVTGCDVVFHVAAKAGIWGPYHDYYQANVVGTENVLAACRLARVPRLVYTSSPSVVFNGQDMEGVDESIPYATHFEAHYPRTKALAEQKVLQANDTELATVAIRPHLIWGPGDNHLVPRILSLARVGRLRRIGRHQNLIDSTYVDNAAAAHLLAANRLFPGSPVNGNAYFLSQGEPLPLWDLINRILATADLPPVTRTIPLPLAYAAGWLLETLHHVLPLRTEPRMTRFLARELATAHWFNITAARCDLGYHPTISIAEGLARLKESFARRQADA
jgi:nucleoside-diphosphate-sugar epimerase